MWRNPHVMRRLWWFLWHANIRRRILCRSLVIVHYRGSIQAYPLLLHLIHWMSAHDTMWMFDDSWVRFIFVWIKLPSILMPGSPLVIIMPQRNPSAAICATLSHRWFPFMAYVVPWRICTCMWVSLDRTPPSVHCFTAVEQAHTENCNVFKSYEVVNCYCFLSRGALRFHCYNRWNGTRTASRRRLRWHKTPIDFFEEPK